MNVYSTLPRAIVTYRPRPFTANACAIRCAAWMRAARGLPIRWED